MFKILLTSFSGEIKAFKNDFKKHSINYLSYSIPGGIGACLASSMKPTVDVDNIVKINETEFRKKFAIQRNSIKIQHLEAAIFIGLIILFPFSNSLIPKILFYIAFLGVLQSSSLYQDIKREERKYKKFKINPEDFIEFELKTRYAYWYGEDKKEEIRRQLQKNKDTLFR